MKIRSLIFVGILLITCVASFLVTRHLTRAQIVEVTGDRFNLSWKVSDEYLAMLADQAIEIEADVKTSKKGKFALMIVDGVGGERSPQHTGSSQWERLTVKYWIKSGAKYVFLRFVQADETGSMDAVQIQNLRATAKGETIPIDYQNLLDSAGQKTLFLNWVFDGGTADIADVE